MTAPISHFIANGPLTTAFQESGEGPAFVLVHGFTGSKLDFQDQLSNFDDLRRSIAYDQRGHGESSNQPPYTFEAMVADLVGLLDALRIDRCDLLGHSLGGMVALRAVLAHPERFDSLLLMDTAATALPAWSPRQLRLVAGRVESHGCIGLLDQWRRTPPTPDQQLGIDYLGEDEHWRRLSVKLEQMDSRAFVELATLLGDQPSLLERLPEIRCPTTILVGERDGPLLKPAAAMAGAIGGARQVAIPAAGHSPQYENAAAWCEAVREHLLGA